MGRAERRLAEKREKKTNKDVKRAVNATRDFDIDILMTCFALAEHKMHGFGRKRISKTINCVCEMMDDILTDKATIEDYKKILEEKAKVRLSFRR